MQIQFGAKVVLKPGQEHLKARINQEFASPLAQLVLNHTSDEIEITVREDRANSDDSPYAVLEAHAGNRKASESHIVGDVLERTSLEPYQGNSLRRFLDGIAALNAAEKAD